MAPGRAFARNLDSVQEIGGGPRECFYVNLLLAIWTADCREIPGGVAGSGGVRAPLGYRGARSSGCSRCETSPSPLTVRWSRRLWPTGLSRPPAGPCRGPGPVVRGDQVFGVDAETLNDDRIGRALDAIAPHLDQIVGSIGGRLRNRPVAPALGYDPEVSFSVFGS